MLLTKAQGIPNLKPERKTRRPSAVSRALRAIRDNVENGTTTWDVHGTADDAATREPRTGNGEKVR